MRAGRSLVLGAGGFLGGHLVRAIAAEGGAVTAVSRRKPAQIPGLQVAAMAVDLFSLPQAELDQLVASADVVHHLAWSTLPGSAEADPSRDAETNVAFTVRLLQAVRKSGARLVFCSSGGTVYGRTEAALIDEDHPLRPIGVYGASKVAAETYAGQFRRAYGVDVRVARLSNPFGTGQAADRMQGALSRFARLALAGEPIEIWGDGEVVRDYLHVEDAVAGLLRVAEASPDAVGKEAAFNIASGAGASLNQLVAIIGDTLGRRLAVEHRPGRAIDVSRNVLSIARAEARLGWTPTLSLEAGVRRLLEALGREAA